MTIITTQSRIGYMGDGISTVFPIPFEFFLNSDITAVKTTVGGVASTLVQGIDYTLSGAGISSGGTATKTLPLLTGETLTLFLNPPIEQESHYPSNNPFPASTLENDLDRQTQISQRLNDQVSRSLRAPDADLNPGMLMATAAQRANTYQAYDSNGNSINVVALPGTSNTQASLGPILFPASPAEIAASVVPTAFYINRYKDIPVERYGAVANAGPGSESVNTAALASAIKVASAINDTGGVVILPPGVLRINASLPTGTNGVNIQGSGKFTSFLQSIGFASDQPILNFQGTSVTPIDSMFCRDFAMISDNNLARGISASWVIHSEWKDLYFYQLKNGWVGDTCFNDTFSTTNAFQVTGSTFILGTSCNGNSYNCCHMVGNRAMSIVADLNNLNLYACDIEGVLASGGVGGAGLYLAPAAGKAIVGIAITGTHFEHINGFAIQCAGADASSVRALSVNGSYFFGDAVSDPNPFAAYAVQLFNVNGFEFAANEFGDWSSGAFLLNGSESNGRVQNNPRTFSVPALSNQVFAPSTMVTGNFAGPQLSFPANNQFAPLYGPTVTIDRTLGETQIINVTNGTAFTVSPPINISTGQRFTLTFRNVGGGTIAIPTMTGYNQPTFPVIAAGFSRSFTYEYNGTVSVLQYRTDADVPN